MAGACCLLGAPAWLTGLFAQVPRAADYFGGGEVVGHPDEGGALPWLAGECHLPQMLTIMLGQGSHRSRRSCMLVTGGFHHHTVTGTAKEAAAEQQQPDSSSRQEQDSHRSRGQGQGRPTASRTPQSLLELLCSLLLVVAGGSER